MGTERNGTAYGLHQEQILILSQLDQDLQLLGIGGEGLFTKHILACLETQPRILVVVAMRGRDIDDVHIGILDQLSIRTVGLCGLWSADLFQEGLGSVDRG